MRCAPPRCSASNPLAGPVVDQRLSEAIVLWTGRGLASWPQRDERRLVETLGSALAADLYPEIVRLADEFYESDAWSKAKDLEEMFRLTVDRFRLLHPELSDEAIEAFAWCYTFDYK